MRSALARAIGVTPTNESELRAMRAAVFHKQYIAVLHIDRIRSEWLREAVIQECEREYGKKQGG
jgi:hypothetical protein